MLNDDWLWWKMVIIIYHVWVIGNEYTLRSDVVKQLPDMTKLYTHYISCFTNLEASCWKKGIQFGVVHFQVLIWRVAQVSLGVLKKEVPRYQRFTGCDFAGNRTHKLNVWIIGLASWMICFLASHHIIVCFVDLLWCQKLPNSEQWNIESMLHGLERTSQALDDYCLWNDVEIYGSCPSHATQSASCGIVALTCLSMSKQSHFSNKQLAVQAIPRVQILGTIACCQDRTRKACYSPQVTNTGQYLSK